MAAPNKVQLNVAEHPVFYLNGIDDKTATKASELLQKNHEEHHIFFNDGGFHNHIAHHLLTIYALGASNEQLQRHYLDNTTYQRPLVPVDRKDVEAMSDPEKFKQYLGNDKYYHDYLVFFQQEMQAKGWQNVVNEYLLAEDDRADNLLVRTFSGFLHPIIHLGFGIEFNQPAIIAEALAQACVHDDWLGKILLPVEQKSRELATKADPDTTRKTLAELLQVIHNDKELHASVKIDDANKIRDGILTRAGPRMIEVASQYYLTPSDSLAQKTAEMINASALFAGGAQNPPKNVKFDFFYMHCINCSIFFSRFVEQDWLSDASKRRLLEWKARNDLVLYTSRGAPELLIDDIKGYTPKETGSDVFARVLNLDDDGHASKLLRALANGKAKSKPFEGKDGFEVKGEMWDKLLHMAIDSVEDGGPTWIRNAGFQEAWSQVGDRADANKNSAHI